MEIHFPLILDGATGTQLQKRGYNSEICAEQWVLEHPDALTQIQQNYVAAGSQVVYAPTFGANRVKLEENSIFNQVEEYNKKLVQVSKQATDGKALVAGDIAPTGKFLLPMGDASFEEIVEIYTEQAKALEEAGVDLFVIETTMTLPEARAAMLAVKSVSSKPVMVTFTCDETGKTLTGTDVTAALVVMQEMGADAFGLNCSVGPEDMLKQIKRLSEYAKVPLIAKPNAGMPEVIDGKTLYRMSPEDFANVIPQLADAGVAIFGGCCGSEEGHIAAVHDALQQVEIKKPAPLHQEQLVVATEKDVFLLPQNVQIGKVIDADENLADAIDECEEDVIAVRITAEDQLDDFSDCQYAVSKPLCLLCEDASVLEEALRRYQGIAMYEGNLPEETLLEMQKKYGMIF